MFISSLKCKKKQNIFIIGGGPAGLTTSLALKKYGFEVTVLEASAYDKYCAGEHIVPEAKPFLSDLGIPDSVWLNNSLKCYEIQSCWGGEDLLSKDSISNVYGEGFLLSRPAFDKDFASYVESQGVNVLVNARATHLTQNGKGWITDYIQNGESKQIQADFVVDASGRNTKFASAFGIKKNRYDNFVGITFFCTPKNKDLVPRGKILIEACKKGWWYSAVLNDDSLVTTVMTDADLVKDLGGANEAVKYFIESSIQTKNLLANFERIGKAHTASAKSQIVSQIYGNNWLMVGDSAWSIDPLSSQGIYKGMAMGLRAAEAISKYFSGDDSAISQYADHFKKMFYTYVDLRAKYYRMETRWKEESFWKRRHTANWLEMPISIDPQEKINYSPSKHNKNSLKVVAPSVDESLLSSILDSSATPHIAAVNYKEQSKYKIDDKELIVAIQEMLN